MTLIERSDSEGIATLTLNAPDRMNVLSDEMLATLDAALAALEPDRQIAAVILAARGKAFCAGHDLKEMTAGRSAPDGGAAYFADLFARCSAVMQRIVTLPQPVIARVHGVAAAAGCQLVASCDMAIAAQSARFAVNGVNIGLFCSTPMVALSRNIPRKLAFEMLTTGAFVGAGRAAEIGLVNRAVPDDALAAETDSLARVVAGKLSSAVRIGKRAFYEQAEMSLADAYEHAGAVMARNMMAADTDEGIRAFVEKRDPDWKR